MNSHPVAFITGASRGIGKQAALALAKKGFDIVITARTLTEGEQHERGNNESDTSAVSGSLETTAREIEALGQKALPIRLDLLDTDSINQAVDQTLATWGRIDLLLNNGIYQGPGTMTPVMELTAEQMQKIFQGNVFSQLLLVQRCMQHMLEQQRGCIINMASESGMIDPPAPAGKGGWGFAYSSSKAALIRMVGVMKAEHQGSNVKLFNVEPGFIVTEMMQERGMAGDFARFGGAPPTVPAEVIAWLATHDEAEEFHGQTVSAQKLCKQLQLVEGWPPARK
jgi:NAD(P)-dependent dehydrogenase (short-subunit alcohol dehydrogenase family)